MRHEIISPTHNLFKYERNWGVSIHSEELQWILYRHVFAHVLWIQIAQVGACVQLWQTLIALLLVGKRWTRYQNAWKNVVNMLIEKIWRFYVVKCQNARLRAEMHKKKCSRANFENAYNGLKRVQKKIETNWSILKFWYARTCASRCARGICWHF